jgi:anti-anti-sigma factor
MVLATIALTVLSVAITSLLVDREIAAELTRPRPELSARLAGCIVRAAGIAAGISGVVALVVALSLSLRVARPLRRLNDLAAHMVASAPRPPRVATDRGHEVGQLGATLERLAATLRRQDDLRRATAADVTHELRGGLGAVIGRVEAAQDGLIDAEAGLRHIADDARRMRRIVDDMQLLVEAQQPAVLMTREPLDLDAIVRSHVSAYAGRFSAASIALEQRLEPARVDGDRERLEQVVDNLLANALRYTDPGGRVTVSLTRTEHEAVLEVADSGIGISPGHLTRVFDRFWRAPAAAARAADGSGVGLALVRDLVLAHHGRVEVASRLGSGSRFSVHLPVAMDLAPDRRLRAPASPGHPAAAPPVYKLRGDIDIANATTVQRTLLRQIWTTSSDLTLDLSEVGFFGSSGLAILAAADSEIRARGGHLIIVDAPPEVLRLLHLVGVPRSSDLPPDGPGVRPGAA